jgi:NADH-quinone oxidoreductase subunit K
LCCFDEGTIPKKKKSPDKKTKMLLDLANFLTVSTFLFLLGLSGIILNRRNIIIVLMSIELILLAVNLNFIVYSVYLDDLVGQVFALFILTVAAAESAIGLAILVVYYRVRGSIAMETINLMHGLCQKSLSFGTKAIY